MQSVGRRAVAFAAATMFIGLASHAFTKQVIDASRGSPYMTEKEFAKQRGRPLQATDLSPDVDMLAMFIGSSNCAYSKAEALRDPLQAALDALAADSDRRNIRFAAVGMALDISNAEGLEYLKGIARFDSHMTGEHAHKLATRYPVMWTTPQIVVLRRSKDREEWTVAKRIGGVNEIIKWSRRQQTLVSNDMHASGHKDLDALPTNGETNGRRP
jgi:hypothetical protein